MGPATAIEAYLYLKIGTLKWVLMRDKLRPSGCLSCYRAWLFADFNHASCREHRPVLHKVHELSLISPCNQMCWSKICFQQITCLFWEQLPPHLLSTVMGISRDNWVEKVFLWGAADSECSQWNLKSSILEHDRHLLTNYIPGANSN